MKKSIIAFLLAALMMLSFAACTGGETQMSGEASTDPLTKDDVIRITLLSHASWPYNENWKIWEYIEEGTGATVEINAVPSSDYGTKYPLMFASPETLPDLVTFDYKPDTDKYAIQGAFIAFDDMTEYMPNYNAWVETLSEEEVDSLINTRKAYDGKVYYAPATGREANTGVRAWLYRKDIFDKHGLTPPTTFDELYEVCKKLKELYPDSFPLSMRQGVSNLSVTGSSWKEFWSPSVYYDYNTESWEYGARDEILVEILEFYKKMIAEKLMPSDFMTINTQSWQELVSTGRGFVFPEYRTRINFFNSMARETNPEFNLTAMVPPVGNAETGVPMVTRNNEESLGYAMCNTGDEKRIANAAKYLDWFYSDEAVELVSWGKEGETYEVVDGKKQYITDDADTNINILYGFTTHGSFLRYDPEATIAQLDEGSAAVMELTEEHTLSEFNPVKFLAFNDEESKIIEETAAACKTYAEEMIAKFVLGQEPISNFDTYVENLNDMGVDRLLSAYESAYKRMK